MSTAGLSVATFKSLSPSQLLPWKRPQSQAGFRTIRVYIPLLRNLLGYAVVGLRQHVPLRWKCCCARCFVARDRNCTRGAFNRPIAGPASLWAQARGEGKTRNIWQLVEDMPVLVADLMFVGGIASLMVLLVQRLLVQGGCFRNCRLALFLLFGRVRGRPIRNNVLENNWMARMYV